MVRKQLLKSRLDPFCVGTIFFTVSFTIMFQVFLFLKLFSFLLLRALLLFLFHYFFTQFHLLQETFMQIQFAFFLFLYSSFEIIFIFTPNEVRKKLSPQRPAFSFFYLAIKIKFNVDRNDFK